MRMLVDGKKTGKDFERRMDGLISFAEHLGLLMCGGWDTGKATGTFHPQAHRKGWCVLEKCRMPIIARITAKERKAMVDYGRGHKLNVRWKR